MVLIALAQAQQYPVTVTYYWAVPGQTDADPHIASCGPLDAVRLRPGWRIIALSRDLFFDEAGSKRCGEIVFIKLKTGEVILGVVWDTMNRRFKRSVDVLEAVGRRPAWGKTTGILEFVDGY